MKTPEEIKRGLECCLDEAEGLAGCTDCPYADGCITDSDAMERDALAYIRQLEAERGSATSQAKWISAKTPPEYDKRYIVWDGNRIEVAECWGDGEWANHHFGVMICGVTHYMPLPKVPEEE